MRLVSEFELVSSGTQLALGVSSIPPGYQVKNVCVLMHVGAPVHVRLQTHENWCREHCTFPVNIIYACNMKHILFSSQECLHVVIHCHPFSP